MNEITWATPLYEFVRQCNESPLEKSVLDCGAGGDQPPLSLFYRHGYETAGIEITEEAWSKAQEFCRENNIPLNICRGDMRMIPFADESFSFVYSFNAIFFMTKPDIRASIKEMARVLKPGGLCYINFRSVDDPDKRKFSETAYARRLLGSERFSDFEDDEADEYFTGFDIIRKEKRIIDKKHGGEPFRQVMIDYIVQKL